MTRRKMVQQLIGLHPYRLLRRQSASPRCSCAGSLGGQFESDNAATCTATTFDHMLLDQLVCNIQVPIYRRRIERDIRPTPLTGPYSSTAGSLSHEAGHGRIQVSIHPEPAALYSGIEPSKLRLLGLAPDQGYHSHHL